jgi:hypothetical protein
VAAELGRGHPNKAAADDEDWYVMVRHRGSREGNEGRVGLAR